MGSRSQFVQPTRCVRRSSRRARNRLGVEWLEPRHLLTGSSSPIAAVQPYNGEFVSQSPQEVVITFNGLNVPAFMGSFDVQIEELNRDGTKTPLWSFDDPPPEQSDATGTELIVPLQTFNSADFSYDNLTLPAGQYEIDLLGGTGLSYAASGAFGPGPQLWDPNQDHAIGTFTVVGQGATLSSATSLGVIGPTVQTASGLAQSRRPQKCGRPLPVHTARRTLLAGGAGDRVAQHRQLALAGAFAHGLERHGAGNARFRHGAAEQSQ